MVILDFRLTILDLGASSPVRKPDTRPSVGYDKKMPQRHQGTKVHKACDFAAFAN